jgi:hypothetical protein
VPQQRQRVAPARQVAGVDLGQRVATPASPASDLVRSKCHNIGSPYQWSGQFTQSFQFMKSLENIWFL